MSFCEKFWSAILEYDTVKFVKVKNKKVGLVYRLVQLTILGYIIGYVLVVKKGYQQFSDIESAVTTKVKGVVLTNFSDADFNTNMNISTVLYNRLWDITDLVIPPSENDAFFITTNVVITPGQKLGTCAESPSVAGASCNSSEQCTAGKPFMLGHGVSTGNCITYDEEKNISTCEISAWCPLETDGLPLNDTLKRALLNETGSFTVLIKNFISFPLHGVSRRNILNTQKEDYLNNCNYDPNSDPLCPVFVLKDIVMHAGFDYNQMAIKGGVVGVVIDWDCNLDFNVRYCIPTYSFKRFDNPDAVLAPGWNFRYANFFSDNRRTLYKFYGIDFVIVVTGRSGRFNIVPLLLNVGSGMALMTLASIICDLCILYVVKKRELYKTKKYRPVQTEYDSFLNPDQSGVRQRSSSGHSSYTQESGNN